MSTPFYALRQMLSLLILPGTVTIAVPIWIARAGSIRWHRPASSSEWVIVGAGAVALAIGVGLFAASMMNVWRRGRGTLAPWDPPQRLVISGPYRYLRHPMISGRS
jgi:protein-S-isoprenylcysteine O-methyltransferase Ste14